MVKDSKGIRAEISTKRSSALQKTDVAQRMLKSEVLLSSETRGRVTIQTRTREVLSMEMYPSLTLGPQRIGDCFYRDRQAAAHMPLHPPACDVSAKAPPPRLPTPPSVPDPGTKSPNDEVRMELENATLWKQFSSVGTEMIITKKGRRMFPGLKLKLSGLNPSLRYILLMDILPADNFRYRFQGGAWQAIGGAEARLPDRTFIHPDSPATGAHWQSRTISFHFAKLTNNTLDSQGHIILHSLHRYLPRVHVIEARDVLRWGGGQHSFVFPETQFTTVTAYQNNKITELKINSNPFAKGFREDGMNHKKIRDARHKRKMSVMTDTLDGSVVNCDPCESTELPPQPLNATTSTDLQALNLDPLPPLSDPSCGFRREEAPYQDTLAPEQPIDLGQAFIASQMSDIGMSMASGVQSTPGSEVANSMIERADATSYTSTFPAAQSNASSFPSAPPPQSSSSFSSLPISDTSDASNPQPPVPPIDYPSILSSSSPTLSSSSTTPSLQQTSFTFPTPPPSNSSSPRPLLSSSSTSSNTYHNVTSRLQGQISAHSLLAQHSQPLQGEPITTGHNETSDQNSAAFIYPNILPANPASVNAQPLPHPNQPAPRLPCSLQTHGGATPFVFPSVPPHMQNLSFPNVSPGSAHPALHLPNLSHQAQVPSLAAAFPPSSFTHPSSSLPHPPFQPSSCLTVSSSFQQSATPLPQGAHPQSRPNHSGSSSASSYASIEMGAIPQFNPPAPYRPEMVLHHPSLLPQLDPSLPSNLPSFPPPPPAFPPYPLRPHSSLSIPFSHLYRQHQQGHPHPQGSYLDIGTRAVF